MRETARRIELFPGERPALLGRWKRDERECDRMGEIDLVIFVE